VSGQQVLHESGISKNNDQKELGQLMVVVVVFKLMQPRLLEMGVNKTIRVLRQIIYVQCFYPLPGTLCATVQLVVRAVSVDEHCLRQRRV
jgi:hypothetical protein